MNRVLLSAAIPVLALLAWTVSLQLRIQSGVHARIRVEGYDPRDLLTGHYIRFSLNLGPNACPATSAGEGDSCICIARDPDGYYSAFDSMSCELAPQRCRVFLRGECKWGRLTAGVERYSIPEDLAPVLQTAPADSSIVLAIDKHGVGQVVKYLVGNEPVEDWARRKISEKEHPLPVAAAP